MDITKISIEELNKDLAESRIDISVCENALSIGVTKYSAGSVQERLDINKKIVAKIEVELKRRSEVAKTK